MDPVLCIGDRRRRNNAHDTPVVFHAMMEPIMSNSPKICLTIGGSDPSGGAGIQADLKTFEAWRTFGMSALTLVTAQNTQGVQDVHLLAPDLVKAQLRSVFDDFTLDGIKIGALGGSSVIDAVAEHLDAHPHPLLVLDPVMVSKHGGRLFDAEGEAKLIDRILPHAHLITPNLAEASVLVGEPVDENSAQSAALQLSKTHDVAVLITGGRTQGETVTDWFAHNGHAQTFTHPRVLGHHQHGAGCTLSAAIAAALAHNTPLLHAIPHARRYVHKAMRHAPQIGHGEGPLHHRIER